MSQYVIKSNSGSNKLEVKRSGKDTLELKIGDKSVIAFTEDLAFLVREELPKDRADEMFSEIDEKAILKGKARVVVKAHKDIKAGDPVVFSIDITKYVDKYGKPTGIRTNKFGFIY